MLRVRLVAQNGSLHCCSSTVAEEIIFTLNEKGIVTYKVFGTKEDIYFLHHNEKENSRYNVIESFFKKLPEGEARDIISQLKKLIEPTKDEHVFMCDAIADKITFYQGNKKLFSAQVRFDKKIEEIYKRIEKLLDIKGFMVCRDFSYPYEDDEYYEDLDETNSFKDDFYEANNNSTETN